MMFFIQSFMNQNWNVIKWIFGFDLLERVFARYSGWFWTQTLLERKTQFCQEINLTHFGSYDKNVSLRFWFLSMRFYSLILKFLKKVSVNPFVSRFLLVRSENSFRDFYRISKNQNSSRWKIQRGKIKSFRPTCCIWTQFPWQKGSNRVNCLFDVQINL